MAEPTILVPTSEVTGDVTICKIERQLLKVERQSAFSLIEKNTYATYNVCTKEIIETYTVPSISGLGFLTGVAVLVFIFILLKARGNRY